MRLILAVTVCTLIWAPAVPAQSLFIPSGERAAEGSVSWSVGPFSNGLETHGGVSLDGRWDVGFGFNRYSVDLDGDKSTFTEWTPFVRYFVFKEDDDGTPVSLAASAQFFQDNFEGDDEGRYVLAGSQLFKKLTLTDVLTLYPFVGFSLAAESYRFGDGPAERAIYLTRQFGIHALISVADQGWVRVSAEEHSFRRETYRAARLAYMWVF